MYVPGDDHASDVLPGEYVGRLRGFGLMRCLSHGGGVSSQSEEEYWGLHGVVGVYHSLGIVLV